MFRDHRLGYAGAFRQSMDSLQTVPGQSLEDRSAGRIGECLENHVCGISHEQIITIRLLVVNCIFLPANRETLPTRTLYFSLARAV